jgi:5-methylcytosine-specific restriction enzyme subunit McrC
MRRLRLIEYQRQQSIALSTTERDLLRAVAKATVEPTPGTSDQFDVTPGSTIGALNIGSLAVQIRPKIPLDRVLFLISYALDPRGWKSYGFDFDEHDSLVEAIAPGFVRQVRRAFRRGLLQGYRSEEEALTTVRGRIRVDDQIRYRQGIAPPIEVRYDDFTEDIELNRLIKAALFRLSGLRIRSSDVRSDLRSLDGLLAAVTPTAYDARRLPEITWTRLNMHYQPAIHLAKLIIQSTAFELHHGTVRSSGFLVDMNDVFENFVVVALREALGLNERQFPQGDPRLRLDSARRITLQPDISWWDEGQCRFVGDLKYKWVGERGVRSPDVYQLLSYVVAADLPAGLLIYAAGEADDVVHDVVHIGRRLVVRTLDVSGSPEQSLTSIDGLAEQIEAMRACV